MIVVDVLDDLTGDDSIERTVGVGQVRHVRLYNLATHGPSQHLESWWGHI